MSQSRRSTRIKRQTQLTFSPLPPSSPAASQYHDQIQRRAAAVRYGDASTPTKRRRVTGVGVTSSPLKLAFEKQKVQVVVSSPSNESHQLPTPAPSSQVAQRDIDSEQEEAEASGKPQEVSGGANNGSPMLGGNTALSVGDEAQHSSGEDIITPTRNSRRTRAMPVMLSSDEELESLKAVKIDTAGDKLRGHSKVPSSELITDLPSTPKSQRIHQQSQHKNDQLGGSKSKARRAQVISSGAEDSTREEEVITPSRRRKDTQNIKEPASLQQLDLTTEAQDLEDDLADLDDTEVRKQRTRGRQNNSERSQRQRKLEELQRRRTGIPEHIDEEGSQGSQADASVSEAEPSDYVTRTNRGDNLDEYEEDFIDNEDELIGVDLGVAGVPLKFTYHANKKPLEHFKAEIEWMVHNKLNPAFDRRDEIYLLAHDKLDSEVQGYGSSKYSSSVWKEDFMKALKSRPEIFRVDVPTLFEHKCDACKRSGHPPKHKVIFTGKAYNRDTLESIENDEDEDDDSDEDDEPARGHSHKSEEEENFFLGRFCCANAEMAHALHHWRYNLNETVLQWLAADGQLSPEKILERENMRQKKRKKAANKIVDGMEATGVIKELYRQFRENLQAARDSKPTRFGR